MNGRIIFFIADDAGLQLGVYGNKVIRSPNIDGLAQLGTTFMNAFTSVSSCSPRYYNELFEAVCLQNINI